MSGLHEEETPKIYEDNLKEIMYRLKYNGCRHQYLRAKKRIEKKLAVLYKNINEQFEGSKIVRSKI